MSRHRKRDRWIAVVCALPEEVRPLVRNHRLEPAAQSSRRWRGRVSGHSVEVVCTGVGLTNARNGVSELVAEASPRAVIFLGTAGAISAGLSPGDLVVAERFLLDDESGANGGVPEAAVIAVPASPWFARATGLPRSERGTLVSSHRVASTAVRKHELAQRHVLGNGTAATDMESWEWASAACAAGIPFVVVRAISDTASEDLPLDFNQALRSDGSFSKARVIGGVLRRPAAIRGLLNLSDRVRLCAERLEQALVTILD